MTSTLQYIKEWKKALQAEIVHLKKYGSTKFPIKNGRLVSHEPTFTYYFDAIVPMNIPNGSSIRLEWGHVKETGILVSADGGGVLLSVERSFGDLIPEANLLHDPWELLDELYARIDEMKESKKKRARVKKLLHPTMEPKHPTTSIKSSIHEVILRSKYNPITFIWGPPGTGKTYTLARVAANKYMKNKRVLLLSHSNQAVDVLMNEMASFLARKDLLKVGEILRYGTQNSGTLDDSYSITTSQLLGSQHPDLAEKREKLLHERKGIKQDLARSYSKRDSEQLMEIEKDLASLLEKIRKKEIDFVKDAKVIGTTLAKAASDPTIYETEYDLIIIDEASMAYVPQAAFAASLGKRTIVCGDFMQLPPIAQGRHSLVTKWLKQDVFHASGVAKSVDTGELHPHLFLLREQRRMHPDISSFTNNVIYRAFVGDHKSVLTSRNELVSQKPFEEKASILLDTSNTGDYCWKDETTKSYVNLWQLLLSFQLIHEGYTAGIRSIGYVTPYRAQSILMEKLLQDIYEHEKHVANIISATVHRFQGSERDMMIFDTVDSFPKERPGMLLIGRESERLINVAITRTKGKFIHVGNIDFMQQNIYRSQTLRKLVDYQIAKGQTVYPNEIGTWIQKQHPKLRWMHAKKIELVMQDLKNARQSIMVALPIGEQLNSEWRNALKPYKNYVKVIPSTLPFPFLLIDEQLVWIGLFLTNKEKRKPPFVAARLLAPSIGKFLTTTIQT